jgi:hypothetical protein
LAKPDDDIAFRRSQTYQRQDWIDAAMEMKNSVSSKTDMHPDVANVGEFHP